AADNARHSIQTAGSPRKTRVTRVCTGDRKEWSETERDYWGFGRPTHSRQCEVHHLPIDSSSDRYPRYADRGPNRPEGSLRIPTPASVTRRQARKQSGANSPRPF